MGERGVIAVQFEQWRPHLQSVAYSMLGSVSEAEDAVQECWLRLDRSNPDTISDLRAWLTTAVGRICLDMLRARKARREHHAGTWLPEPLIEEPAEEGPEHQAVLTDSIGLALLVVLESLTPAERLAFVLHDIFAMPFAEIAQVMERTPHAVRQLASRARQRVKAAPQPDADLALQRRVVDAFLAAARAGDFDALLAMLHPDVVFRFDLGPERGRHRSPLTGADAVTRHMRATALRFSAHATPMLVNGVAGWLIGTRDNPVAVLGFTIVRGRIAALDLMKDPAKLRRPRIESLLTRSRAATPPGHTRNSSMGRRRAQRGQIQRRFPRVVRTANRARRHVSARLPVTPSDSCPAAPDIRHHCSCSTTWRTQMSHDNHLGPVEGMYATFLLVVSDQDRSRHFYQSVFGGKILRERDPVILEIANTRLILNVGGGPTDDKPTITLATPSDPDRVSAFLNIRVADISKACQVWSASGAEFLTEPKDHGREIRAYIRDPDGHLIEVGQTTPTPGSASS